MGDVEREVMSKPAKRVTVASLRERTKGLQTKKRIFLVNHGEWVTAREVAKAAKIHKSTAVRELRNLRLAGLMKAEKRGSRFYFKAIAPKNTEMELEMFLTTREIDFLRSDIEADYSWMPPIVRKWGGYRVMGAAA